jgi:hypothetical protein
MTCEYLIVLYTILYFPAMDFTQRDVLIALQISLFFLLEGHLLKKKTIPSKLYDAYNQQLLIPFQDK